MLSRERKEHPLVSISIPTLNSHRTIGACLSAIQAQTYRNIEIIVVDSYSTDGTIETAKDYGAVVYFEKGLTHQRLECIRRSQGDYMLLLDSDMVISPNLVEICVSKLQDSDADALILRDISTQGISGLVANIQSEYLEMTQSDSDALFGTALPRFFRAGVLRVIGSPRRELGYFDHAWIYRRVVLNGGRVAYVDAIDYHLEFNSTIFLVRKFYKFYGHYFIPAMVEDWRLVLAKSMPKRSVFLVGETAPRSARAKQFFLFSVKGVSTLLGIIDWFLDTTVGSIS